MPFPVVQVYLFHFPLLVLLLISTSSLASEYCRDKDDEKCRSGVIKIDNSLSEIKKYAFSVQEISGVDFKECTKLVRIDYKSFANNKITHLSLPNSVSYIGDLAFKDNKITSLIVPPSVAFIGQEAFAHNQIAFLEILSSSISIIGEQSFAYNKIATPTPLIIPESVLTISIGAFANNEISSITIGSAVTNIGEWAFFHNLLSNHLDIPSSVLFIGNNAFSHNKIVSLKIPESLQSVGDSAFAHNEIKGPLIFPSSSSSSLAYIGEYAFHNNQISGHLSIPSTVSYIGERAFAGNPLITSACFEGERQPSPGKHPSYFGIIVPFVKCPLLFANIYNTSTEL